MDGSPNVRSLWGRWDHWGTSLTDELPIPVGVTLPKGTWVDVKPGANGLDHYQLASGDAVGFTTQDVDNVGHTDLSTTLTADFLGVTDRPVKKGGAVSCRQHYPGSYIEFEGAGAAAPGNLVITSGTGALSVLTAKGTELSFLMGGIRVAQPGEFVHLIMDDATLATEIDLVGRIRIRVRKVSPYVMP